MIVHFPIALVIGALGADLLSLLVRRWDWLRPATVALYLVAGVSTVATYFTGTWAADAVSVPAEAQSVLTEHSNLGWWTMWFFGVYALGRLGLYLWLRAPDRGIQTVLLVFALGGSYLVYQTGDHGAEMVFRYGVGVQGVDSAAVAVKPGLTVGTSGWQWRPQSDTAWMSRMRWLEGGPSHVQTVLDTIRTGALALSLTPDSTVAFVVPDTIGAVQVTAEVNLDGFDGTLRMLHHVQDTGSYDALTIEDSAIRLGRMSGGSWAAFASSSVDVTGWARVRVVGDGTHFRGYVGDQLVVHGHGDAADPGPVGLRLEGTGRVRLRSLRAEGLQ